MLNARRVPMEGGNQSLFGAESLRNKHNSDCGYAEKTIQAEVHKKRAFRGLFFLHLKRFCLLKGEHTSGRPGNRDVREILKKGIESEGHFARFFGDAVVVGGGFRVVPVREGLDYVLGRFRRVGEEFAA